MLRQSNRSMATTNPAAAGVASNLRRGPRSFKSDKKGVNSSVTDNLLERISHLERARRKEDGEYQLFSASNPSTCLNFQACSDVL